MSTLSSTLLIPDSLLAKEATALLREHSIMATINDFQFEVLETFQNQNGSRVASRWRVSGENNGVFGMPADQRHTSFTGTAVWAVRYDGKLSHNWVKRSFYELNRQLHDGQENR